MIARENRSYSQHCACWWSSIDKSLQWRHNDPWWRLKSPASRLFTQSFIRAQIKENIKASRHWPLCGEFTGTGEFPAQRASYTENVSIWWRHHVMAHLQAAWWPSLRTPYWGPGAHFTNNFSIVYSNLRKFHSALIQVVVVVVVWSRWNIAQGMACAKFCNDTVPCNGVTLK